MAAIVRSCMRPRLCSHVRGAEWHSAGSRGFTHKPPATGCITMCLSHSAHRTCSTITIIVMGTPAVPVSARSVGLGRSRLRTTLARTVRCRAAVDTLDIFCDSLLFPRLAARARTHTPLVAPWLMDVCAHARASGTDRGISLSRQHLSPRLFILLH